MDYEYMNGPSAPSCEDDGYEPIYREWQEWADTMEESK